MQPSTRSAVAAVYDDAYFEGGLADWHRLSQPTFTGFLQQALAGRPAPRRALDLGCGGGVYGPVLAAVAGEVTGCDLSPAALRRAAATGAYDRVMALDLETSPIETFAGPYDLVFSTEVLEHLADERAACRRIASLLAPGGLLVLTTTAYHFYLFYYLVYAPRLRLGELADYAHGLWDEPAADRFVRTLWSLTGGHHHGFAARRLLARLREAGLSVDTCRHANVQPVFPSAGLSAGRFRRAPGRWARGPLALAGRAINATCRRSGRCGANLMVAAVRRAGG